MFSLIITIIAIALVAALALATIYYGGSAFNKGASSANAAKLLNQSQQILGADRLYRADHEGAMPPNMQALVDGGYLKAIPTASVDNKFQAVAASATEWTMVATASGRAYQYSSNSVDADSCKTVNQMSFSQDGILNSIFSGFKTQCYTSGSNAYTVLVLSDPTVFTTGASAADLPGAPQYVLGANPTGSDWAVAPTSSSSGNTGGSTGGSSGGSTTPPKAVIRAQLSQGASNSNWADYLYSDENFTVKTSSDFSSGLMVARLIGADGQCGYIVNYMNDVYISDAQAGTLNSCFVLNTTPPGDYTMQVIDGSYQTYYVPVTVTVSNK